MLLVFAACGGGGDEDSSPSSATTTTTSTTTEPAAVPTVTTSGSISALPTAMPADSSTSSTGATTTTPAATPEVMEPKGEPTVDRLIISDAQPSIESNNPWEDESPRGPYYMNVMFDSLIAVDPLDGSFIPGLAEEFSFEPDGASIRLKLRRGVQFHGGNGEFIAADVVATHLQHTREDAIHTHRTQYRAVTPEIINDYEVVMRTDKPNPELVPNLSERNVCPWRS